MVEEQVAIALGAVTRWRDLQLAIKGFSGEPGASYAKVIVRKGDDSQLVRLELGATAEVSEGVSIRLDEVPPPSRPEDGPAPTGRGRVLVTVRAVGEGGAR
ncbi:hypothetical protein ACTXJ3_16950 [Brachybacterium paraconglomeratum]|uniref:hypothetical protein n=1 Tax=Brachybacterium paraconglomeratum TaxID=173362 RepID=UPI003FD630A1